MTTGGSERLVRRRRCVVCAFAALAAGTVIGVAAADPYPSRPIKVVVPWPPGSIVDLQARRMGERLARALQQPVVIDNRPGASGTIGLALAAKSQPDGYTIAFGSTSNLAASPAMGAPLAYDPGTSFQPITLFAHTPLVLVANPALGIKDAKQLIALARTKPGVISYASSGPTSTAHVLGALFEREAGVRLLHVPYKGSGQALMAVLSNEVAMAFDFADTCAAQVRAGKLQPLLVTGPRRIPLLPDVPTAGEAGLDALEILAWGGVLAPAGLPAEIVTRLNAEFVRILRSPDVQSDLANAGWEVVGSSPEEFARFIASEQERWGRIVERTGIKIEE